MIKVFGCKSCKKSLWIEYDKKDIYITEYGNCPYNHDDSIIKYEWKLK